MIDLTGVEKHYGATRAIRGVSFQIDSNQIVGLLGPNGAGKTTLIRVITCYHFPTEGEAVINGHSVVGAPREVKAQIGYLPENAPLYSEMTVIDYLTFMGKVRGLGVAVREERIRWVVHKCALESVLYQQIATISKGFRQRVGLAQAILHDPPILVLDEPTSGLDPNQIIEIRSLIKELGRKKMVILSTHILQEVEALCDKVLILHNGALVAQGTTAEIAAQMKGEERFSLLLRLDDSVDSGSPARLAQSLGALKDVHKVVDIKAHPRIPYAFDISVSVRSNEDRDAGEALFDWAVSTGGKMLRLTASRIKLEDIFAQLTTSSHRTPPESDLSRAAAS